MPLVDLPAASIACQVVETHAGEMAKIQLRIEDRPERPGGSASVSASTIEQAPRI